MKNALVLARKDFESYVHSWAGVLVSVFFLLIAGIFFSFFVLGYAKISLEAAKGAYETVQGLGLTRFVFSSFFLNMGSLLIFWVPLLSMRAFAEERKQETLELLFTYPLSDFEIVWGKFLALLGFLKMLLLPTLVYVLILSKLGGDLDWGPVAIGYAGFLLLGSAYLSLGLFISSLADSQIVSAIVTFGCLLIFWILDWVAGVTDGFWAHFFSALSPLDHFREFTFGVLDLSHIAYFVFFHFYFLFLTLRSIETRHWKG